MQIRLAADLALTVDEALGECFMLPGLPRWARFAAKNTNGAYFASEADEKEFLKRQAKFLESQLDDVKKRLGKFED